MNVRNAYTVIVPPELQPGWGALAPRDHGLLNRRLRRAARAAWANPTVWPETAPRIHRGRHRAIVRDLWLLYQLDDQAQTLRLLGFGHVTPTRGDCA